MFGLIKGKEARKLMGESYHRGFRDGMAQKAYLSEDRSIEEQLEHLTATLKGYWTFVRLKCPGWETSQ